MPTLTKPDRLNPIGTLGTSRQRLWCYHHPLAAVPPQVRMLLQAVGRAHKEVPFVPSASEVKPPRGPHTITPACVTKRDDETTRGKRAGAPRGRSSFQTTASNTFHIGHPSASFSLKDSPSSCKGRGRMVRIIKPALRLSSITPPGGRGSDVDLPTAVAAEGGFRHFCAVSRLDPCLPPGASYLESHSAVHGPVAWCRR